MTRHQDPVTFVKLFEASCIMNKQNQEMNTNSDTDTNKSRKSIPSYLCCPVQSCMYHEQNQEMNTNNDTDTNNSRTSIPNYLCCPVRSCECQVTFVALFEAVSVKLPLLPCSKLWVSSYLCCPVRSCECLAATSPPGPDPSGWGAVTAPGEERHPSPSQRGSSLMGGNKNRGDDLI